ncbi:MAG: Holliday junction branch migration protein RuvA [Myxococcota bacterium]|nr:Holliday junction branch migration protein RuvA [Myxococcota bacterium]
MIARLEGVLSVKAPTRLVVDVGGVGYEVLVSLQTFERLPETGKTVALNIRTVVREDAFLLYGFATALEKDLFDLLLRANRVGPRLAQAILSGISAGALLRALSDSDAPALRRAPGVGAKLAERICLDLGDGARELMTREETVIDGERIPEPSETGLSVVEQLISALENLGYASNQAERVAVSAAREAGEDASLENLIRVALRSLAT